MSKSVLGIQEWKGNNRTFSDLGTPISNDGNVSELCANLFDLSEPSINSINTLDMDEPGSIYSTYKYDLDLVKIHAAIRLSVISHLRKIEKLKYDMKRYEMIENDPSILPIDKRTMKMELDEMSKKLLLKDKLFLWNKYVKSVTPILNRYVVLMSREFKGKLTSGSDVSLDESKIEERLFLIENYLNVIRRLNFIKISITRDDRISKTCPNCLSFFNYENFLDGQLIKCNCGYVSDSINKKIEYFDTNKNMPDISSTTINTTAWREWIDNYLCRRKKSYPKDELFMYFDYLCGVNGFPNRYHVLNGLLQQPPAIVIINLLQQTKIKLMDETIIDGSDYYCIKNTIRHDYYGWQKPTLTQEQEFEAESLYIKIQSLYPLYKTRKTNIHCEILGFYILHTIGINVIKEDFKIASSIDTIEYSNTILEKIFNDLGIPFRRLI